MSRMLTQAPRGALAMGTIRALWDRGTVGGLSDADLLGRFLTGPADASEAAFAALVARHGGAVRRVCLDVLGDPHEAQDAAQAAFLVLARRARSVRKPGSLGSWLHGVALRVARKSRVRAVRRREAERKGVEAVSTRREATHDRPREPYPELHEEIDRLPENERGPIVLFHLHGYTQEQAAQTLGWPLGTLQTRLHRGRRRLRDRLTRRGVAPAMPAGPLPNVPAPASWAEATARAAVKVASGASFAGVVSSAVATLAEATPGLVVRQSLRSLGVSGLAFTALATAAAVAFRGGPTPEPPRAAAPVPQPARAEAASPPDRKPGTAEIRGTVVDEAGRPVPGAEVTALGWETNNDPVAFLPALTAAGVDFLGPDWLPRNEVSVRTAGDGSFALKVPPGETLRFSNAGVRLRASAGGRLGVTHVKPDDDPAVPRRIVLKAPAETVVRVVDGRGKAVDGASVEVFDNYATVASGRTAGSGELTLILPADSRVWQVVGLKRGVGYDYAENFRTYPPDPAERLAPPGRVTLTLDGARAVRARVVGSHGKPLPNVVITPWYVKKPGKVAMANPAGDRITAAVSGADGVAVFPWFPAKVDGRVSFLVRHGQPYSCETRPAFDPDKPDATVTLRAVAMVGISGKVTFPDGRPAPGIMVISESHGEGINPSDARAVSGPDGLYALQLPAETHAMVAVDDKDWAALTRRGINLDEGRPHENVDLRLAPGTVITGKVTMPDGKAAPGQVIRLRETGAPIPTEPGRPRSNFDGRESISRSATTGPDGRYAIRVGPGAFEVSGPFDNTVDPNNPAKRLKTTEQDRSITRDYTVDPKFLKSRLDGRVVDRDGKPVAGAVVEVNHTHPFLGSTRFSANAGADGRFSGDRYGEPLAVAARTPDGALAGFASAKVDQTDVEITLTPASTARGRVVDQDGKPLAGVRVQLGWGPEPPEDKLNYGPFHQQLRTGADGRFATGPLPLGAHACVQVVQSNNHVKGRNFRVDDAVPVDVDDIVLDAPPRDEP